MKTKKATKKATKKVTKKVTKKDKNYFPDSATLERIRKKLSDKLYDGGNFALPENATEVERVKYQICQMIARYMREHRLLQKELAKKLGVDESRISDILRGKIESFTLDRLITYSEKLYPKMKLHIVAA